jgi:protein-tyrosine phosphatase
MSGQRHYPMKGIKNFRDVGGYRTKGGRTVKWKRIFRSDAHHPMKPEDISFAADELKIRTIIDLRSGDEIAKYGKGPLLERQAAYHHLPLLSQAMLVNQADPRAAGDVAKHYAHMMVGAADKIALAVQTLAAAEAQPAVIHCMGGKDRTGILTAVLLGALEVNEEEIINDYALSELYLGDLLQRLKDTPGYEKTAQRFSPAMFTARPKTMERLLLWVKAKYRDMGGYVRSIGVPEETIARLRGTLLE